MEGACEAGFAQTGILSAQAVAARRASARGERKQCRAVYSDAAAEFIVTLPKHRQRKLVDSCTRLARHPFITSDYVVKDASGREIEHLMVDGFVIAYWVDVPVKLVMIVEVDDVD